MELNLTAFLGLFKPRKGSRGWAEGINQNFDIIDDAIKTLSNLRSSIDTKRGVAAFNAENAKEISFDFEMAGTYAVLLTASDNITCWAPDVSKLTTGFTIKVSSIFTGSINWFAVMI